VTVVPLEAYNEVVHDLEKARAELIRARQKIAHLLKEKKDD
jgi:hypothetical protein